MDRSEQHTVRHIWRDWKHDQENRLYAIPVVVYALKRSPTLKITHFAALFNRVKNEIENTGVFSQACFHASLDITAPDVFRVTVIVLSLKIWPLLTHLSDCLGNPTKRYLVMGNVQRFIKVLHLCNISEWSGFLRGSLEFHFQIKQMCTCSRFMGYLIQPQQ